MPDAPSIDPTALALLSIFGGAALSVIAGLIGAAVQGRREHSRWKRERRFDAYAELFAIFFQHSTDSLQKDALARLALRMAESRIIGSPKVRALTLPVMDALKRKPRDDNEVDQTMSDLRDAMARDLGA